MALASHLGSPPHSRGNSISPSSWLITAYVLVGVVIATNLVFERWTRQIDENLGTSKQQRQPSSPRSSRPAPLYSLAPMVALTLMIVFVMVVKPTPF